MYFVYGHPKVFHISSNQVIDVQVNEDLQTFEQLGPLLAILTKDEVSIWSGGLEWSFIARWGGSKKDLPLISLTWAQSLLFILVFILIRIINHRLLTLWKSYE